MRTGAHLSLVWLLALLLAVLPILSAGSQASSLYQGDPAQQKARALLAKMTPEERVGQLFLVTMTGSSFDEKSQIYDLVTNRHVGGVVLTRANNNFTGPDDTPAQAYQLIHDLQLAEWASSRSTVASPVSGAEFTPNYMPLLIGVSQDGDNYPNDQILNGVTSLPDQMAIGATWNPSLSQQVGAVMGRELSALGFNLYFGPSLDVLDAPTSTSGEDLGVGTFGGDPYWVGKLGQAYISGLHQGSSNRMIVIAKNFPGRGGSDRSSEEEVATVRKSLEQLKQIELAPFFAVTGNAASPDMATDGLLVSHIRYQGFQGNIRATTRPVSSDAAALDLILSQTALSDWRKNGGIMISDNLGSQAIRRFYDPSGNSFDASTVAREAFLAGNDLLYADHFVSSNDPDVYTTIVRTLDLFAQKYRQDDAFAQRVNTSVERLLTLKYRLYPEFNLDRVSPAQADLSGVGTSQAVSFDVARRSVTLISPAAAELASALPRAPESRDRIVFLTDVQVGRQCSICPDQVVLPVDSLQAAVLRLYGPQGGRLVSQNMMSSYPFSDLIKILTGIPEGDPVPPLVDDLKIADWVVVSMLKPNPNQADTMAFRRLLRERQDLLRNKKVVVFAFNGPYYLDSTDISKLTAYYALYSKTPGFVDVAAKVLFQEQPIVPGALPVSVPGVGYDLFKVTAPDPTQEIPLYIDSPEVPGKPTAATQEPTRAPIFKVEDIIPLRTGIIYDHNRNPVPDGTSARFVFNIINDQIGSSQTQVNTETKDGVARATYRIDRTGILEISVVTDQGARSSLIRLDMLSGGITVVPPTPQPTETPTPTVTVTPTATVTPTVMVVTPAPPTIEVKDWFLSLLLILGTAAVVSWMGVRQAITRWGLRWALCGFIGGILAYIYIAVDLPGGQQLVEESGTRGVLAATLVGILAGWAGGLIWKQLEIPGRGSGERQTGERSTGGRGVEKRPATGPKSQSG